MHNTYWEYTLPAGDDHALEGMKAATAIDVTYRPVQDERVSNAGSIDEAKQRWNGRFNLAGTKCIIETDSSLADPVMAGLVKLGDNDAARAYLDRNSAGWDGDVT